MAIFIPPGVVLMPCVNIFIYPSWGYSLVIFNVIINKVDCTTDYSKFHKFKERYMIKKEYNLQHEKKIDKRSNLLIYLVNSKSMTGSCHFEVGIY